MVVHNLGQDDSEVEEDHVSDSVEESSEENESSEVFDIVPDVASQRHQPTQPPRQNSHARPVVPDSDDEEDTNLIQGRNLASRPCCCLNCMS